MNWNLKKISRIEERTQRKNSHQLNNVDLDDNLDADDQECVQSSRKRERSVDSLTTRRGRNPVKMVIVSIVFCLIKNLLLYIKYGLTDVYKWMVKLYEKKTCRNQ